MLRYLHQAAPSLTIIPRQERVQDQVLPRLLNLVVLEAALAAAPVGLIGVDAIHLCGILVGLRWGKDISVTMDFIM